MNRVAGIVSASAEVRNAVTVPAIEEIFNELRRLDAEPVPDPELGMQREYLAGNYLLSLESPVRTAERVQDIDLYKLPVDYYQDVREPRGERAARNVKALADKYLGNPDRVDRRGGWRGQGDQGAVGNDRPGDGVRHGPEGEERVRNCELRAAGRGL